MALHPINNSKLFEARTPLIPMLDRLNALKFDELPKSLTQSKTSQQSNTMIFWKHPESAESIRNCH